MTGAGDEPAIDGDAPTLDAIGGSGSQHPSGGRGTGEPALPAAIGRFHIERTLGTGGMGVVYLAEDPSLGRRVAIKLLLAERAQNERAKARLQREARALASLSHPNVVVVHEVGLHDEQVYLVMEHVDGPTLREWARARRGDWRAIVAQYRAAGEGLAAAHRAGIIHRDFKPDNVLVAEDGRPRVLDFGLASPGAMPATKEESWDEATSADLTKTGSIMGTPAYMAPEQFLGGPADARTDQFSFCVALWEALFGRRPFGGDDLPELRSRVIAGRRREPPARTQVPRSIIAALARGLSPDPEHRFPNMPELLRVLADPRPSRRRAWIAVGLGSLAATALAARTMLAPTPTDAPAASEPAPVSAVAPEDPSLPTTTAPAPELPPIALRPLTRTTGYGVSRIGIGPAGGHVAYASVGDSGDSHQWWQLSPSSAEVRPIALSVPYRSVLYPDPAGSWWQLGDAGLDRVGPDGSVERIFERRSPAPSAFENVGTLAPDGGAIAVIDASGFEVWDLRRPRTEPVRVQLDSFPWGMHWSPDSQRIGVIVRMGKGASFRVEVYDIDGSLRSSTPWADALGGKPMPGLAWTSDGLVTLVSRASEAWVQCLEPTDTGVRPGPRSAAIEASRYGRLMGASDDRTLILMWPEVHGQVLVLEGLDAGVRQLGPAYDVRLNDGDPVWLSDAELAFLAAEPPGALVKAHLDAAARIETLAPGPYAWASSDGEGGVVAGGSADGTIEHWAKGATRPRRLRLPGVGATDPYLRCRDRRDCLMTATDEAEQGFLAVDLEREHVRRLFGCPAGTLCRDGRWSRSLDGKALWVVDDEQREVSRLDGQTGARLGEPLPGPAWAIVQSPVEVSPGELLVSGMLLGEPPEGPAKDVYVLMRVAPDGSVRRLWGSERTWLVRPRASPSGRRLALEGQTFHTELMAIDLGSLCDRDG